jgi:hypothetical protein
MILLLSHVLSAQGDHQYLAHHCLVVQGIKHFLMPLDVSGANHR